MQGSQVTKALQSHCLNLRRFRRLMSIGSAGKGKPGLTKASQTKHPLVYPGRRAAGVVTVQHMVRTLLARREMTVLPLVTSKAAGTTPSAKWCSVRRWAVSMPAAISKLCIPQASAICSTPYAHKATTRPYSRVRPRELGRTLQRLG